MSEPRVICWFSCGVASAVATKLALQKYPHAEVVRQIIAEEHPDNERFSNDCARWFGKEIRRVVSERHAGSVFNVIRSEKYVSNRHGAPCTRILKKDLREALSQPNDLNIFGYTAEEQSRWDDFLDANNDIRAEAPALDASLTHTDCLAIVRDAGIELPVMYRLGYKHNNCIGCSKASGAGYWNMIRRDFPERFAAWAEISEAVGARMTRVDGKRIFLRELPEGYGNYTDEEEIQCGAFCHAAKLAIQGDTEYLPTSTETPIGQEEESSTTGGSQSGDQAQEQKINQDLT